MGPRAARIPPPPALCRLAVAAAARVVPQYLRQAWRRRWLPALDGWWTLRERGEAAMPGSAGICSLALGDACDERRQATTTRATLRHPLLPLAASVIALLLLAGLSAGFPALRGLIAGFRGTAQGPTRTLSLTGSEDQLVAHSLALAFAFAAAIASVVLRRPALHFTGWRGVAHLLFKTVLVLGFTTLAWIDGSAALRVHIASPTLRILAGGLAPTIVFITIFVRAARWCVNDHLSRCPVCLRRLVLPVTAGSWASVFEAPVTELLCELGHGRLAVAEAEAGAPGSWRELDESWHELFVAR